MRLNDVFAEFEARGIFLDNHSKAEAMRYYEKLNLIEKKSDCECYNAVCWLCSHGYQ